MNGDTGTVRNREALDTVEAIEAEPERPYIDPEGFHDAKSVAPGYDVYALYDQWVSWWIDSGRPELKSPRAAFIGFCRNKHKRSEEHTSELQSLMRISYAVFCLKKKTKTTPLSTLFLHHTYYHNIIPSSLSHLASNIIY